MKEKNIIWEGKGSSGQNNSQVGIKAFTVTTADYTVDSSISY